MSACVAWAGTFHEGYPMLGSRRAHRVAYENERGPIPPGHVVHHACDNKACVNPERLETMTPREHILLHRSWEKSHEKARAQTRCKHGHERDGWRMQYGALKRYCRACHNASLRRQRAIRRLAPVLPHSPLFARAVERDDAPASVFEEEVIDAALSSD